MAIYNPPTEDLPIFDTSVFVNEDNGLTIAEGDARYLRFPVSQGGETISGALVVSGQTTLAGATYNAGVSPAYEIKYPVNSGRFDFYANTSGGVSTRGGKIDATGVHTISKFDTIDETAGILAIGTSTTRTGAINIGTGNTSSSLPITIGNQTGAFGSVDIGTTTITVGKSNTATNNIQTSTNGTLNLKTTASSGGVINMGTGMTSGTINIGSGTGDKTITIGNTAGANILNLTSNTVNLQTATGSILLGSTATAGTITIGGSSSNSLSIQRPIQLSSGADPASSTSAIGYIAPLITGTSIAIAVPANTYTWSTGARSLGIGVWMLSLGATIVADFTPQNYVYNMGFMSSAPTTGDSATASSAPANTIASINGNLKDSDPITITNGTYIYNVGGVVVNNYGGTFNNVYGIFNADWSVAGTIAMTELSIRAVKIG